MNKLIRLLGIGLLALLAASPLACNTYNVSVITPPVNPEVDESSLYQEMYDYTMLVIGESGTGSGVAFDGGKKVLTAAHVVSHDEPLFDENGNIILGDDGYPKVQAVQELAAVMKGAFLSDTKIIKFDSDLDLAILELEVPWTNGATFTSTVTRFQKCWTSGHPLGVTDTTIIEGRVQSLWDHGFVRYSALSTFGNSGGPVFVLVDGKPKVFSICQRVYVNFDAVAHLGLGVLPDKMLAFLELAN